MNNTFLKSNDLADNPSTRVPVILCLDTSGSMDGSPIDELNGGVQLFYDAIRGDEVAMYAADIGIVTFGDTAQCVSDFTGLSDQASAPRLTASGMTPMGEAVNLALDMLERRKREYKNNGIEYFQPWLVLMTDGKPNGEKSEFTRAIRRTVDMEHNRKLTIFPIGIGSSADMNALAQFSAKRSPLKLQGLKFREFFSWLSKSVSTTSQSVPDEAIPLDFEGIKGWATLD
ncbi:MAG: VWA domain-containing protein [Prevotella sp.]|nr:VWA domain-containing protein [Prevotella sp.]